MTVVSDESLKYQPGLFITFVGWVEQTLIMVVGRRSLVASILHPLRESERQGL